MSVISKATLQKFIGINLNIQETFDINKVTSGTGSIEQVIEPMSSKGN
jgi:hypothetical protein